MKQKGITYHIFASGRVQGVGFRSWVVSGARHFSIRGWVRNTEKYNCVEILAQSYSENDLMDFIATIKTEHPFARVENCEVNTISSPSLTGFKVVR